MSKTSVRYIKETEVSEITGIARQTLKKQRSSRDPNAIPWIRLGKKMIRYNIDDVIDYMESRKVR